MINKILSKIEYFFYRPWLNIPATIYLNLRLCKFSDAIRLPLWFYGRVFLDNTQGKIKFPNGCKPKMITFGKIGGHFLSPKGKTYLFLAENSKILFYGKCSFSTDISLRITPGACVEFENNTKIGDSVKILADKFIHIGECSEITFGCQIIDTNFHYIKDLSTNKIKNKAQSIYIGKNNWIGNNTTIMKGTQTPDWCIIASKSLTNKKFGNENFIILAGTPANIVGHNQKRIYSILKENKLNTFFKENNHECYYDN